MMHHRQIHTRKGRHNEKHHGKGAVRDTDGKARENHPEHQHTPIESEGLPEGDLRAVLWGHVKHRLAKQRLDASPQTDEEHRPEQHRAVKQIGKQLSLLHPPPVKDDVVEHRCDQEHRGRNEHPQGEAHRVVHQRQHKDVDHDVDRKDRRQRERVGEQNNVQLLKPRHPGEQNLPGVTQNELHVPLRPLTVALGECLVVDREFLLAEDVRSEPREKPFAARLDRKADVLSHHMREAVGEFVALTTRHRTVSQK